MLRDPEHRPGTRSLTELFRDLFDQCVEMVRDEARLARAEMSENAAQASNAFVVLAVALVIGIGAVVMLLFAATAALSLVWPSWAAALAVGAGALVMTLVMGLVARWKLRATALFPHRTVRSVRTDAQMAKERIA
ncbi:MAG: phage holin family protein [Rhodospirillaceae bacterium]